MTAPGILVCFCVFLMASCDIYTSHKNNCRGKMKIHFLCRLYFLAVTFAAAIYFYTVRPLLSAPLLSAELDYPWFLRPKLNTPNLYEIQSVLYYSHLYYPRTPFIRSFWDQNLVRPSTADNRGLTVLSILHTMWRIVTPVR